MAKILLLTPEIKNPGHRGIYAFTKTTFSALKRLGFRTALLTQSLPPEDEEVLVPKIIHDLANPRQLEWLQARKAWLRSHYRRLGREVANDATPWAHEWKWRFLSDVDFFYNSPGFFDGQEFGADCFTKAPLDLVAHWLTGFKHSSGEIGEGAIDIDFVREAGYRLVITTSPFPIKSRSGEVKIAQTLHDLIPIAYPYGSGDPGQFFGQVKASIRHADQVIAMSNYTKAAIEKALPAFSSKITTVYQGNPSEPLLPAGTQTREADRPMWMSTLRMNGCDFLLYLGAIERRKNIEVILNAFRSLGDEVKLHLVLAGPSDPNYLKQIGLRTDWQPTMIDGPSVHYLGEISDSWKVDLIRHARALVFPAVMEGFGLPVIEAMSIGCPVITTRGTSLTEVGGDAVLYLDDPGDAAELATSMRRVALDQELADALRAKGLRRSHEFSIDAYAERLRNWGRSTGFFVLPDQRPWDAATREPVLGGLRSGGGGL